MNVEQVLIEMTSQFGVWAIVASFGIGLLTSLAPCSIITLPLLAASALGLVISFSLLMLLVSKMGMMLSLGPFWAYLLAALATFTVVAYALGFISVLDKEKVTRKFLKLKLFGAMA